MRRRLFCASLLATASLRPAVAVDRVVRLTNGEWPPYMSQHLPHYGVASHIVTEAFRLEGIRVEYGFFPWPRALVMARTALWHGSLVWQNTPERSASFNFSDSVIESGTVFFHRKSMPFQWKTIADLKRYRIGITNGYFYGAAFGEAVKRGDVNVEVVSSDELNFRKLLQGRIELFPCNRITGMAMLAKLFPPEQAGQIVADTRFVNSKPLSLMLNRLDPANIAVMQDFNRGLAKLRASGELERILMQAGTSSLAPKK